MFVTSRWRLTPLLMSLLLASGALVACHKDEAATPKKGASAASGEVPSGEVPSAESLKQALDGLNTPLEALNKKFLGLRQRVESLPADLEGFGDTRAKFYSTVEARHR